MDAPLTNDSCCADECAVLLQGLGMGGCPEAVRDLTRDRWSSLEPVGKSERHSAGVLAIPERAEDVAAGHEAALRRKSDIGCQIDILLFLAETADAAKDSRFIPGESPTGSRCRTAVMGTQEVPSVDIHKKTLSASPEKVASLGCATTTAGTVESSTLASTVSATRTASTDILLSDAEVPNPTERAFRVTPENPNPTASEGPFPEVSETGAMKVAGEDPADQGRRLAADMKETIVAEASEKNVVHVSVDAVPEGSEKISSDASSETVAVELCNQPRPKRCPRQGPLAVDGAVALGKHRGVGDTRIPRSPPGLHTPEKVARPDTTTETQRPCEGKQPRSPPSTPAAAVASPERSTRENKSLDGSDGDNVPTGEVGYSWSQFLAADIGAVGDDIPLLSQCDDLVLTQLTVETPVTHYVRRGSRLTGAKTLLPLLDEVSCTYTNLRETSVGILTPALEPCDLERLDDIFFQGARETSRTTVWAMRLEKSRSTGTFKFMANGAPVVDTSVPPDWSVEHELAWKGTAKNPQQLVKEIGLVRHLARYR